MPFSFFSKLRHNFPKTHRQVKKQRSSVNANSLSFQSLEPRQLLAGIFFDSGTGVVTVSGDQFANIGEFEQVSATVVRASLNGFPSQDFTASDVSEIVFIGFGGDDQFTNGTAIDSLLLGQNGNDTLFGGSGFDQINGGAGNDEIHGNGGNDRLLGSAGDDTVFGGEGNDEMFAGDGTNTMHGEAGDDVMFGGNQVDTLNGNVGRDEIFGLAGNDFLNSGDGGVPGTPGISQAELVLGLDGDDTLTGGNGLNVIYGGNGNDTFTGTTGENRMHGQNGDDILTGGSENDYLAGNLDNDTINGGGGSDFILPGFGDDSVNAGDGNDFVVFTGDYNDYVITGSSTLTVNDTRGIHGIDTVTEAETFRFDDGDRDAESDIVEVVTIQPIIVSNTNGTNTAEYFGNASQESEIMKTIDEIFYQAKIDIAWLAPTNWNNTFANVGDKPTRPTLDLDVIVDDGDDAGKGNSNPIFLDVYFVEVSAGYSDQGENTVYGLAYVGGNGVSISVGDELVTFEAGRDLIARVVAHEIGHNLGLDHVGGSNNLMATSGTSTVLDGSQITSMLDSPYSVPV